MEREPLFIVHGESLGTLVQVDQCAGALARNHLQRAIKHLLAIAKRTAKYIARQAMRVHAYQHGAGCAFYVAFDQGNVRFPVELVFKSDHPELAVARREHGLPTRTTWLSVSMR